MRGKISIFLMVVLIVSFCIAGALAKKEDKPKLADEPILYSDHDLDYKMFIPQRLLPIYQELSQALNSKLRFHVLPFMRRNYIEKQKAGEEYFDEVLEVCFQGKTTSIDEYRKHADNLITAIQKEFKDLSKDCYMEFYVRLPEGIKIADIDPELPDECKQKNTIYTYVKPTEYSTDSMEQLFKFVCGDAIDLDVDLEEEQWPIKAGMWRATPEKK